MANEFKVEVPISIKGGNAGKSLANDFLKNIKGSFSGFGKKPTGDNGSGSIIGGLGKIAASVGIIASIWQGIAPIFKPVLKMFSILLTLLLLPLMPLIRTMVSGLAKTAGKVGEAQEAAGGGYAGLIAGFGEVMKSPTIWAMAGVGIAASFVASLGSLGIVGLIMSLISLSILWDSVTSGDESTLGEKLSSAGWAGLSAGIAALIFGAGSFALPIGLMIFGLTLGVSLLGQAMQEEDLGKALLQAAGGSLMLGLIAGGIAILLGLGLGAAGVTTLAVGTIVFTLFAGWKIFGGDGKMDSIQQTLGDQMTIPKEVQFDIDAVNFGNFTSGIENTRGKWMDLNSTINTDTQLLNVSIDSLGQMIGSPSKGSYPLVYSIGLAKQEFSNFKSTTINMVTELMPQISNFGERFVFLIRQVGIEWGLMKDKSVEATNGVIDNLNRIPREITTNHYIRTVYI